MDCSSWPTRSLLNRFKREDHSFCHIVHFGRVALVVVVADDSCPCLWTAPLFVDSSTLGCSPGASTRSLLNRLKERTHSFCHIVHSMRVALVVAVDSCPCLWTAAAGSTRSAAQQTQGGEPQLLSHRALDTGCPRRRRRLLPLFVDSSSRLNTLGCSPGLRRGIATFLSSCTMCRLL